MTEKRDAFSLFRAVSPLVQLLSMPGMRHHAMVSFAEARRDVVPGWDDTSTRNRALKELFLAGALYRCGDQDGLGRTLLERYAVGLQAHYARYAYEVLQSRK